MNHHVVRNSLSRLLLRKAFLFSLSAMLFTGASVSARAQSTPNTGGQDWSQVQSNLPQGWQGKVEQGVLKVNIVRQDQVTVEGKKLSPAMVLEGYVAFEQATGATVPNSTNPVLMIGEFPFREEEVEPAKQELEEHGVNVSAIHNHEIGEQPRWIFIHVESVGDGAQMANSLKQVLKEHVHSKFVDVSNMDTDVPGVPKQQIQSIMPPSAQVNGVMNVVDVEWDRPEQFTTCAAPIASFNLMGQGQNGGSGNSGNTNGTTTNNGSNNNGNSNSGSSSGINLQAMGAAFTACQSGGGNGTAGAGSLPLPSTMGPFSDFTFQKVGNETEVDVEFSLLPGEVNPVINYLEHHGFKFSAVHNHMLTDNPRLFFLHGSASGSATNLAQTIRAALDMIATSSGAASAQ